MTHDPRAQRDQWLQCSATPLHFIPNHVRIPTPSGSWTPFALWPAQIDALRDLWTAPRLVVLKARQLGATWLALAYALWLCLFCAPVTILVYSLREFEARELLARLDAMHSRLPRHLRNSYTTRRTGELHFSGGSRVVAMSSRSGRSYTARFVLVDEADYIPDLNALLNAAKPTVDAGGQLCLVSTPDRRRPLSVFKTLYKAAAPSTPTTPSPHSSSPHSSSPHSTSPHSSSPHSSSPHSSFPLSSAYSRIFLPWYVHPQRDPAWYTRTLLEMRAQKGRDEEFLAEYPATEDDALSPMSDDKRIPLPWLQKAWQSRPPLAGLPALAGAPALPASLQRLPGLAIFHPPQPNREYIIGADPAEGTPTSDESSANLFTTGYTDSRHHTQVAHFGDRLEPASFAAHLSALSAYYNHAPVIPERNNHGHALILALEARGVPLLRGPDDRPGWLTTTASKTMLYDLVADLFRDDAVLLHDDETAAQLASIELLTLAAPTGCHDDRALSAALALAHTTLKPLSVPSTIIPAIDPLIEYDRPYRYSDF